MFRLQYMPSVSRQKAARRTRNCVDLLWQDNLKEIKIQEKYLSEDLKGRDFVVHIGLYGMITLTVINQVVKRVAGPSAKGACTANMT